jgi:hypothetical protein
LCNSTTKNN